MKTTFGLIVLKTNLLLQQKRQLHKSVGIVGLPNVGKSTLFNAITKSQDAQAANYPFCTIEPNIAKVPVPDERLHTLAKIEGSKNIIETRLEFTDIAGLVRGASNGEGLGNQFLSTIRQVAAIVHVIRCFKDPNIIHVDETINPLRDLDTIRTELILSDLQMIENKIKSFKSKNASRTKDPQELKEMEEVISTVYETLENGNLATTCIFKDVRKQKILKELQLLTNKPVIYLCNVSEDDASTGNDLSKDVNDAVTKKNGICLTVSAALEEEALGFEDEESQIEYLRSYGLETTGLRKLIQATRELLSLQTFYTIGEKEARAWTIPMGTPAPMAAGVIHSDFEKHFIRAETISYNDFINAPGEEKAKALGLIRSEGKDYICQDGDIFHFLIGR